MELANQFKGLPMESLIGGPLKAACEANVLMAEATSKFINDVGFLPEKDEKGNIFPGAPRMVDFSYEKPGMDAEGNSTINVVKIKIPILAVVPIPNLQVNNVDVSFDMEVKNSTSETDKSSKKAGLSANMSFGYGPISGGVKISGSISASHENTRKSDNSAKYHVEVNAKNFGVPEGLARVLDLMSQSAAPRRVEQYKPGKDGEIERDENGKAIATPVIIDQLGKPVKESGNTP